MYAYARVYIDEIKIVTYLQAKLLELRSLRSLLRISEERETKQEDESKETDGFIILLRHRERATRASYETMKRVTGI